MPPLTARSLIASLLLGLDPPRAAAQFLVRSNELFGVNEGTTRTALSRMVAAGELSTGNGTYELSGELRSRQNRQSESRRAERLDWDGTWILLVIGTEPRSATERAAFRDAAKRLRLVEWREGLWCRPDNLDPQRLPESRSIVADQTSCVVGADPQEPPIHLFGAAEWANRTRGLIGEMEELAPKLTSGAPAALERGFLLSAEVIRHFGTDPLLPDDFVESPWPGADLRQAFNRHETHFKTAHRRWFAGVARDG